MTESHLSENQNYTKSINSPYHLIFLSISIRISSTYLSLSLICSKSYRLFLPALPKKFTHYSYFILISLPIIPILFFCIQCFGYVLTSREIRTWYLSVLLKIYCANFSDTSKMVNESHPHLFLISFIPYVCHCLPLILIPNRYRLFFHYAFECPIILKLFLWVSYNSQNYACKISHL